MVKIKTAKEIEIMREGGKILSQVLSRLAKEAIAGAKLEDLDALAEKLITEAGATPSFKGYKPSSESKPYPGSACLSVGAEIVHGIARGRTLKEGDLLKIDLGVFYKGLHADSATTIFIGEAPPEIEKLMNVTKEALERAIKVAVPGKTTGDIGHAIEEFVHKNGLTVVAGLVGHGVGERLQEDPMVPNVGSPGVGVTLKEGMVIAIEPMVTLGKASIILDDDGFTYKMADGALSAHFEHTVAITAEGNTVLTK